MTTYPLTDTALMDIDHQPGLIRFANEYQRASDKSRAHCFIIARSDKRWALRAIRGRA